MSVAIRRDGSVERADVIQSSGIKLLDAAAMRIAKLAEPYPPLPKTEENIDVLPVTRTWNLLPGGELIDERGEPIKTSIHGLRTRARNPSPPSQKSAEPATILKRRVQPRCCVCPCPHQLSYTHYRGRR